MGEEKEMFQVIKVETTLPEQSNWEVRLALLMNMHNM